MVQKREKETTTHLQHIPVHVAKLFNVLPKQLRDMTYCSIEEFKFVLDNFLSLLPDQPNIPGAQFTPGATDMYSGKPSNYLIDQIRKCNINNPQHYKIRQQGH